MALAASDPLQGTSFGAYRVALSEIKRNYRPKRGGAESPLIERLTLHAEKLRFPRADGSPQDVQAPLPKDFTRVLKQLAKVRPPGR